MIDEAIQTFLERSVREHLTRVVLIVVTNYHVVIKPEI